MATETLSVDQRYQCQIENVVTRLRLEDIILRQFYPNKETHIHVHLYITSVHKKSSSVRQQNHTVITVI